LQESLCLRISIKPCDHTIVLGFGHSSSSIGLRIDVICNFFDPVVVYLHPCNRSSARSPSLANPVSPLSVGYQRLSGLRFYSLNLTVFLNGLHHPSRLQRLGNVSSIPFLAFNVQLSAPQLHSFQDPPCFGLVFPINCDANWLFLMRLIPGSPPTPAAPPPFEYLFPSAGVSLATPPSWFFRFDIL